jgi:phosphoglycolate phosphatase-like HAD superfamily hydrolase
MNHFIWKLAMKKSNKIILFDIDDTLIKSDAKIYVLNEYNQIIKKLTPAEYNTYVCSDGEHFGYDEFDNEKILNEAKLTKFWNEMIHLYNKGYHIGIVTAREDKEMLIRFFLQHGIDINRHLIFAVGGEDCKFKGRIQDRKRQVIEHLSARGYKNFCFYDDNEKILNEVAKMRDRIGVNIKTIKVN